MNAEQLNAILDAHGKWRRGENGGIRANLTRAYLTGADLTDANLSRADLTGANLSRADLTDANLTGADLTDADLTGANLTGANLTRADLTGAYLTDANLTDAYLTDANLTDADLTGANLTGAYLTGANLSRADLTRADLSQAKGVFDPAQYIADHFKRVRGGIEVFKTFGLYQSPPASWIIKPGAVICELANPTVTQDCGSGVNVATAEWIELHNVKNLPVWRCLIKWEWMPGVVVPWNTDGKIRASKVKLIEVVES